MIIKFIQFIKPYLLVLFVLVFAYIFGKKMDSPSSDQGVVLGTYSVSATENQYKLNNHFIIQKGECGKLFLDLKNTTGFNVSTKLPDDSNIKVILYGNIEEKQEIGSIVLPKGQFTKNTTLDLCANADYTGLIFKKEENSAGSSFEISDVQFFPLASSKKDFNSLKPIIKGDTDFTRLAYDSNVSFANADKGKRFSRHNQTIGQTFTTDSELISGVDLKLKFSGMGGIGSYYLELREASNEGKELYLGSDRIAYYYFSPGDAEKNLKISENMYHIPLAAKLEKGKTYFIGISNEAVKFNILNTLTVYGGGSSTDSEKFINSINGQPKQSSSKLYLKAYSAIYSQNAGEKILTNAKIIDEGDSTGIYNYEQKGNFSDYLDISILDDQKVFYDNVQSSISAKDTAETGFIYKINTVYPIAKINISASQPGGQFTDSLVYYSLDNQNWHEIEAVSSSEIAGPDEEKNEFQKSVQINGQSNTVYVKITYDKEDTVNKNIHLFGLKKLKVYASLIIR